MSNNQKKIIIIPERFSWSTPKKNPKTTAKQQRRQLNEVVWPKNQKKIINITKQIDIVKIILKLLSWTIVMEYINTFYFM